MDKIFRYSILVFIGMLCIIGFIAFDNILMSKEKMDKENNLQINENNIKYAYFSGGCFWCVESDFEKLNGVLEVTSGYISTNVEDSQPEYKEVASGKTNFRESVEVEYDSSKLSYEELVSYFLTIHDPTDFNGSFGDRGFQYSSAIHVQNDNEREISQKVIDEYNERDIFDKEIITQIDTFTAFYIAEQYHQDYYSKNPVRYSLYRKGSGREDYVNTFREKLNEE